MAEATLAVLAAAKAVERIVNELYDTAAGRLRDKVKRWKSVKRINSLYRKIWSVRKVKTIWHTENSIDLLRFYYPSKILENSSHKEIRKIDDFDANSPRLVIEGTVGQGKSIFLRFLAATELFEGKRIPLFAELRNIGDETDLMAYLAQILDEFGFDDDPGIVDFLITSGKVALFLDGFDEVRDSIRPRLIRHIEHIATKYEQLPILITSRPDNDIDKSPHFRVVKLAPLRHGDIEGVIDKLVGDHKFTENLMQAVNKSHATVQGLLHTPLMVTLLVIAFKSEGKIPGTIADFYEALFNTLLLRHDKTKPGYARQRTSGISDRSFREAFDGLCFAARQRQATALPSTDMQDVCGKALQLAGVSCDCEKFLNDVKKITCLILEEGSVCHFIHKSIAEYHCASFIRTRPELFAKSFYERVLEKGFDSWRQDLQFLEQLDRYRFYKYFILQDAGRISPAGTAPAGTMSQLFSAALKRLTALVSGMQLGVSAQSMNVLLVRSTKVSDSWLIEEARSSLVPNLFHMNLKEATNVPRVPATENDSRFRHDLLFELSDLLDKGPAKIRAHVIQACKMAAKGVDDQVKRAAQFIEEKDRLEMELLDLN